MNPLDSLTRPEWIEFRLGQIESYIQEHPLPQELLTFTKQARRMTILEKIKRTPGQARLEDF